MDASRVDETGREAGSSAAEGAEGEEQKTQFRVVNKNPQNEDVVMNVGDDELNEVDGSEEHPDGKAKLFTNSKYQDSSA